MTRGCSFAWHLGRDLRRYRFGVTEGSSLHQRGGHQATAQEDIIDGHSEIHGPTKEPPRVLLNLMVDDLAAEQSRLEGQGVRFIRTAGREYWGGVISTFLDPDGNYIQLIEYKPG